MMSFFNRAIETASREQIQALQIGRFQNLLKKLSDRNAFYSSRLKAAGAELGDFEGLEQIKRLPFTTKQELVDDQLEHPPFGTNLIYPEAHYTRYHQTSGTTGQPLKIPDTADSWDWWGQCWGYVLAAAGLTPQDRLFVAFGFGPFIGFWAAVEGARHIGTMMIPGGARDSTQRLQLLQDTGSTALCSTPTYALRLAEVASETGFDLRALAVHTTIHAGEPGANVPSTKKLIEDAWGAKCYDHAGATEIGAHSFECQAQPGGTHINEAEFLAEVIDPSTGSEVPFGEKGELVLTNFRRFGYPVIRYRTGDIVQLTDGVCECGRTFVRCEGGIIGRQDDMVTVRGVNIYPSAVENLVRNVSAVKEFQVTVKQQGALNVLQIKIECAPHSRAKDAARKVVQSISGTLGLHPTVEVVPPNSLPRFELKARRFVIER